MWLDLKAFFHCRIQSSRNEQKGTAITSTSPTLVAGASRDPGSGMPIGSIFVSRRPQRAIVSRLSAVRQREFLQFSKSGLVLGTQLLCGHVAQ